MKRRLGRASLPALMLILWAGCGPVVRSTSFGRDYPPRPADHEIVLFSVRTPDCLFEEIGLVTAWKQAASFVGDALEAARKRAREMGGDAIVGLSEAPAVSDNLRRGVTGTVIRFTEPDCRS